MLTSDQLKHVIHLDNRSQRDCLLLILAVDRTIPKEPSTIRTIGKNAGVRRIDKWNLTDVLGKAKGLAIKTDSGWELAPKGIEFVQSLLAGTDLNFVITSASHSLRAHLEKVQSPDSAAFVEEAIVCFEAKQYRAAVVLAWVGAVSVLQHVVHSRMLVQFNVEAKRRNRNWREAKAVDDLGRMKEHDFLEVLESIGLLGKNVKQTLQNNCLQLRNSCGHPNALKIAENSVAAHIEKLILNVFAVFN